MPQHTLVKFFFFFSNNPSVLFQADIGGPLACPGPDGAWTLYGIISWSHDCESFSVFSKVSFYEDWIKTTLAG